MVEGKAATLPPTHSPVAVPMAQEARTGMSLTTELELPNPKRQKRGGGTKRSREGEGAGKYICDECGLATRSPSTLAAHRRTSTGPAAGP